MFDEKELRNLLSLSRLTIPQERYATLSNQLEEILHYFERLSSYDTTQIDVDLGASVPFESKRADEADGQRSLSQEVVQTFSSSFDDDGFFEVPLILGDDNG